MKKKRRGVKLVISLFLLGASLLSYGTDKLDSLKTKLNIIRERDTSRVNLLNDLAYELRNVDKEETIKYTEQSRRISEEIDFERGKARSFFVRGLVERRSQNFEKSREYFLKSSDSYKWIKDERNVGECMNKIAGIFFTESKHNDAIEYYEKSLEISRKYKDSKKIIKTLNNIGNVYSAFGQFEKAIDTYNESIVLCEKIGDREQQAISYGSICNTLGAS